MKYEFSIEDELRVRDLMIQLGIPAHLKGYPYVRTSVLIILQDEMAVTSVTKLLYPEVARIYGTSDQKVERAIRNAIEKVWKNDPEHFKEFFNNSTWKNRPTNSEFLASFNEVVKYS